MTFANIAGTWEIVGEFRDTWVIRRDGSVRIVQGDYRGSFSIKDNQLFIDSVFENDEGGRFHVTATLRYDGPDALVGLCETDFLFGYDPVVGPCVGVRLL